MDSKPKKTTDASHFEVIWSDDRVQVQSEMDSIFFEFQGSIRPTPQSNCFALWAVLPIAMAIGKPLSIAGKGCPIARENAHKLSRIWETWQPHLFREINIEFSEVDEGGSERPAERDLVLFSGGVDSTFNLLQRRDRGLKSDLLTLHGLDYKVHDKQRFEALKAHCGDFARAVSGEWSFLRTNAYDVYTKHGISGGLGHGFLLAAGLFLYETSHRSGEIAADYNLPFEYVVHPWGTNSLTNRYFQSSSFQLNTASLDYTRVEKLSRISDDTMALSSLSFCKDYQHRPRNCGVCNKCVRTKAMFLVSTGKVPTIFIKNGFASDALQAIDISKRHEASFMLELWLAARRNGTQRLIPGLEAMATSRGWST